MERRDRRVRSECQAQTLDLREIKDREGLRGCQEKWARKGHGGQEVRAERECTEKRRIERAAVS